MKPNQMAATLIMAVLITNRAYALSLTDNCKITTCSTNNSETLLDQMESITCQTNTSKCYANLYRVDSCSACPSGYNTIEEMVSIPCGAIATVKRCRKPCTTDSDCDASPDWTCSGAYCSQNTQTCDTTTKVCSKPTTKYKCNIGYYGRPLNATSGCTRCPSSGGTYGTTDEIGAVAITECYLPSGTSFLDMSGKGVYTDKCYYTPNIINPIE